MNNFHYIGVLLNMLYGITLDTEDVEELGLLAWQHIGNKNTRLYKYCTSTDSNLSIQLPCNAEKIEAVTTGYEDWNTTTNISNFGDIKSSIIEETIESQKTNTSPYYLSGKFVKYTRSGDTLYFNQPYEHLNILYKGVLMDEEGLPELSDKEAQAIATYIAYITKFKEGLITNNAAITNQANLLKAQWNQQCDQARVTYLSQNDMNEILTIKNSFDRANYAKSYKPIK